VLGQGHNFPHLSEIIVSEAPWSQTLTIVQLKQNNQKRRDARRFNDIYVLHWRFIQAAF